MPSKKKKKNKGKDPSDLSHLTLEPKHYREADKFLREQTEKITNCPLYSSFVPQSQRIPSLAPMTREQWGRICSKCIRLHGNYLSPGKDLSDMTPRTMACSFISSTMFIDFMKRQEAGEFDYFEEDEEEVYPEFR